MQLLGQVRHGSCRPRAILFKVLADAVGLESRLVVVSISEHEKFYLSYSFCENILVALGLIWANSENFLKFSAKYNLIS